jgi:hypothetical protein
MAKAAQSEELKAAAFQKHENDRNEGWPKLLSYWGLPNLQVINRDVHVTKCACEAMDSAVSDPG